MSYLPVVSHTLVISAGLAVGACLKQANTPCIILEQNDRVASAWHRHYDRLHLHTDKEILNCHSSPSPKITQDTSHDLN
jgi:cation diffusion facilitator CzcD-associated flavoprotein CzcO